MPLSEDFARWRDDPITQLVFKALAAAGQAQKAQWDAASWGGSKTRAEDLERLLIELRTRADAYEALGAMTIEDVTAWLGMTNEQ